MVDEIDPRYRALVLVGAYCGLRIGEVLALRWENVDLLSRTLTVVEQVDAYGARPGAVKPPKTSAGRRSVSMPRFVAEALGAHGRTEHAERPVVSLVASNESRPPAAWSGLVFTAAEGGPVQLDNYRRRVWVPAIAAAGLEPLRIHDLRHTCASIAIQAGADVKVLQRMLGHASAAVTLDRYGHLMPGQAESVAARIDDLHDAMSASRFERSGAAQ